MKTRFLFLAVMAVMMAFTGCTKEKIVYVEKENDLPNSEMQLEGNVLRISLSSGLSRAARPIYDGSPANNINRIGLKFIDPFTGDEFDKIAIEKVVSSYNNPIINEAEKEDAEAEGELVEGQNFYEGNIIKIGGGEYTTSESESIDIYLNMEDAAGEYIRIIAYGYNENEDDSADTFPGLIIKPVDNGREYILGLENVTNPDVQEYFAGYVDTNVNAFGLFDVSPKITLERQVAGLLVYLENIPVRVNRDDNDPVQVRYITVNAAKNITGLLIPASECGRESDGNYANGLTGVDSDTELMRFNLKGEGINDKGTFYEFPHNKSVGGINEENKVLFAEGMDVTQFSGKNFANHTLFGSCFILPFDQANYSLNKDKTALYIKYLDEDQEPIKTVALHMSTNDGSTFSYAIWANHFYSIGTKNGDAVEDTDGDGYPDDGNGNPDTETEATNNDAPLDISDLSGTKILELTVNDTWYDVSLIRPKD